MIYEIETRFNVGGAHESSHGVLTKKRRDSAALAYERALWDVCNWQGKRDIKTAHAKEYAGFAYHEEADYLSIRVGAYTVTFRTRN